MTLQPGTLHKSIPASIFGQAKVIHDSPTMLTRLRAARDGQPLNADTYTRLFVEGQLWMTDAEFECQTNAQFVRTAFGDVLIAGLGLGLILPPLLKNPDVRSVLVLEISPDVISLIGPHYACDKLKIIQADCRTWDVPKKSFHCIYLDVWADVPNSDNRADIVALKRKYRAGLHKSGWVKAWCEGYSTRR